MHEYDLIAGWYASQRKCGRDAVGVPEVTALAASVVHATIQTCVLDDGCFDAAISWGMLFHLPPGEQLTAFAVISRALKMGAPFLFTAGDQEGSIQGEPMNGVPFRYYSHSVDRYREILDQRGLLLEHVHKDKGGNTYYLTRKVARASR